MYEWTRAYVKDRKAFGAKLANLQTVRHTLAEMKTSIAVTRAFLDQCILLHHEGRLNQEMASMAKYHATELEHRVCSPFWRAWRGSGEGHRWAWARALTAPGGPSKVADQCVQLHGGWGYMWEYPIARAFVDSRVQRIYGGSNEVMKVRCVPGPMPAWPDVCLARCLPGPMPAWPDALPAGWRRN
jgi:long-chain-acyl-CoA dehydrogenase